MAKDKPQQVRERKETKKNKNEEARKEKDEPPKKRTRHDKGELISVNEGGRNEVGA